MTMYSFDTSAFMDWQARYYPSDIFVSLRTKIEGLVASGRSDVCRDLGVTCINLLGLMHRERWPF